MEEVCPNAWFLNYTNPMAMLTGYMLRYTNIKTVGLCHSVQSCCNGIIIVNYTKIKQFSLSEIFSDCQEIFENYKLRNALGIDFTKNIFNTY